MWQKSPATAAKVVVEVVVEEEVEEEVVTCGSNLLLQLQTAFVHHLLHPLIIQKLLKGICLISSETRKHFLNLIFQICAFSSLLAAMILRLQ